MFSNDVFVASVKVSINATPPTHEYKITPMPIGIPVVIFGIDSAISYGGTSSALPEVGDKARFIRVSFPLLGHTTTSVVSCDRYGREEVSYVLTHYTKGEVADMLNGDFAAYTDQVYTAPVEQPWATKVVITENPQIKINLIAEIIKHCELSGSMPCRNGAKCEVFACTYSHDREVTNMVMSMKDARDLSIWRRKLESMSRAQLIGLVTKIATKSVANCKEELAVLDRIINETGGLHGFVDLPTACTNKACAALHIKLPICKRGMQCGHMSGSVNCNRRHFA